MLPGAPQLLFPICNRLIRLLGHVLEGSDLFPGRVQPGLHGLEPLRLVRLLLLGLGKSLLGCFELLLDTTRLFLHLLTQPQTIGLFLPRPDEILRQSGHACLCVALGRLGVEQPGPQLLGLLSLGHQLPFQPAALVLGGAQGGLRLSDLLLELLDANGGLLPLLTGLDSQVVQGRIQPHDTLLETLGPRLRQLHFPLELAGTHLALLGRTPNLVQLPLQLSNPVATLLGVPPDLVQLSLQLAHTQTLPVHGLVGLGQIPLQLARTLTLQVHGLAGLALLPLQLHDLVGAILCLTSDLAQLPLQLHDPMATPIRGGPHLAQISLQLHDPVVSLVRGATRLGQIPLQLSNPSIPLLQLPTDLVQLPLHPGCSLPELLLGDTPGDHLALGLAKGRLRLQTLSLQPIHPLLLVRQPRRQLLLGPLALVRPGAQRLQLRHLRSVALGPLVQLARLPSRRLELLLGGLGLLHIPIGLVPKAVTLPLQLLGHRPLRSGGASRVIELGLYRIETRLHRCLLVVRQRQAGPQITHDILGLQKIALQVAGGVVQSDPLLPLSRQRLLELRQLELLGWLPVEEVLYPPRHGREGNLGDGKDLW